MKTHRLTPRQRSQKLSVSWEGYGPGFWNADSILIVDYLQKDWTIQGTFYASLLRHLRETIKVKHRGKLRQGLLFHQGNAPAHTSIIAMAVINDCGFEFIQHPLFSPELAPSDFYSFPS